MYAVEMSVFLSACIALSVIYLIYLVKQKWRFYRLIWKLPSPKGHFILGNLIEILATRDDLGKFVKMMKPFESNSVICLWILHMPIILIVKHDSAEPILSSAHETQKTGVYDFLRPWLGLGLLTSSGNRWRTNRKLLTPSFHFSILENFIPIFNEQSEILTSLLSKKADNGIFDLYPFITRCTLDVICETAMGKRMDIQMGKHSDYLNAMMNASDIVLQRELKPWLKLDWMFELSPLGRLQRKCLKIIHGFNEKVIKEKRQAYEENHQKSIIAEDENDKNQSNNIYGKKNRKAFLDTLLAASYKGEIGLTDEMIRDQTSTIMFAGHDTTSVSICWVIYALGWLPSVQHVVHQELESVFGDSDRTVTLKDINELKYLEAVIKETMRMLPSVPAFGRKLINDMDIGGYTIPSGAELSIFPGVIGHDENVYQNSFTYDPTRFFNDDFQKRHPYAFVPFSAGPRNCIGQKFAMMEQKVVLANILRKYEIKAYQSIESLRARTDLVYRPINGIPISLEKKTRMVI